MRFPLFLILSLTISPLLSFCQQNYQSAYEPPKIIPPSPNAGSLGTFGQIPVSLYTGTPNITIPLYSIQEGSIEVPIRLNYHSASVKPEIHPSWVGVGWNLDAGGAITREVKGGVDEGLADFGGLPVHTYSYYDHFNFLDRPDWSSQAVLGQYNVINVNAPSAEPDEFNFNFGEYSGSFYLNHKGKWILKSSSRPMTLKIEHRLTCVGDECDTRTKDYILYNTDDIYDGNISHAVRITRIFKSFIITMDNGTQYVFGNDANAIEFKRSSVKIPSLFLDQYNSEIIAKTWYLTKIVSPEGRTVNFQYYRMGVQNLQTKSNYFFAESWNDYGEPHR